MPEKTQTNPETDPLSAPRRKRRWLRAILWSLLLFCCLLFTGLGWLCRSEGGQAWLKEQLNAVLAEALASDGLRIRLTSLAGPLPFGASFGLELADAEGIWLRAPDNSFYLDWTALPGMLCIDHIQSSNVELARLPLLPPSPPPPPSEPLTEESVRLLLGDVVRLSNDLPDWLPAVRVGSVRLENARVPASLLGALAKESLGSSGSSDVAGDQSADVEADIEVKALWTKSDGLQLEAAASLARLDGTALVWPGFSMTGTKTKLVLQSRPGQDSKGQDSLETRLDMQADTFGPRLDSPDVPADLLGETIRLALQAEAAFSAGAEGPATQCRFALSSLDLQAGALSSQGQVGWQQGGSSWLDGPISLDVKLAAHRPLVDRDAKGPVTHLLSRPNTVQLSVQGSLFRPRLQLAMQVAGIESQGEVAVGLADLTRPAMDGNLRLRVADWQPLMALMPGQAMSGEVSLDLELRALQTLAEGQGAQAQQNATLRWSVPHFTHGPLGQAAPLSLKGLSGECALTDCFGAPALAAHMVLDKADYEGMALGASLRTSGPLAGPLDVQLESSGLVGSRLDARWQPGQVSLRQIELALDGLLPLLAPDVDQTKTGKKRSLGLRLSAPAELTYGESGYGIDGLRLDISPAGRLEARGRLAPDRLDMRLLLDDMDLEPWRMLVPALPEGKVEMAARLEGKGPRPAGDWRLMLRGLKLAGSPLKPMDVGLSGRIEHGQAGSTLTARLELPPATLKALGGENAQLDIRLPLAFGADGLPAPAMDKPLKGQVVWKGALGPLWSLVPQADRRLNGRLAMDVDLAGHLSSPTFKGKVRMEKGRFEDVAFGVLLQDMELALDVDGKTVSDPKPDALPLAGRIDLDFSLTDGLGGSLKSKGGGSLDGTSLAVDTMIERLRPLRRRDVRIDLSGDVRMTGSIAAPDIKGEIRINKGDVLLNKISVPGSFSTLPITEGNTQSRSGARPEEKQTTRQDVADPGDAKDRGSIDIRIRAPGRLMVEGHGLSSQWQTFMRIGGSPTHPLISGQIKAIKGNFDFLTKNFVLSRGVITFGGGDVANPLLDVQLINELPDLTAQINVTGTVRKMKLTLSSEPVLPQDEILSRMLFGRSANELGRMESLRLAAAVAELAGFGSSGNAFMDKTRDILGVDVLRLGDSAGGASGEPGSQTADGTTLEMGKYLTEDLYLGVEQGMKSDSTAFTIQYEVSPRVNMEVRTEQNDTWGGIRWKFDY